MYYKYFVGWIGFVCGSCCIEQSQSVSWLGESNTVATNSNYHRYPYRIALSSISKKNVKYNHDVLSLPSLSLLLSSSSSSSLRRSVLLTRGGGGVGGVTDGEEDEERYSRQFYTLGARAHGLVRSSQMIIDGPCQSGLVYECAKNLALSGVGQITFLTNSNKDDDVDVDAAYHDGHLDDLGRAYSHAARAEEAQLTTEDDNTPATTTIKEEEQDDNTNLLMHYIRRLNPSVKVTSMKRKDFIQNINNLSTSETNMVLLCIDRPQSTQIYLNDACHSTTSDMIPFVSVETAGVFGRAFCDFGPDFMVIDEDGETPKATLMKDISKPDDDDESSTSKTHKEFLVHCMEGEKHDVSKGDYIQFQDSSNNNNVKNELLKQLDSVKCKVLYVHNPTCFRVQVILNDEEKVHGEMITEQEFVNHWNHCQSTVTFSRVKIPTKLTFIPLSEAISKFQKDDDSSSLGDIFSPSDLDKSFDETRRSAVMTSFATLNQFVQTYGHLPTNNDKTTVSKKDGNKSQTDDMKLFRKMAMSLLLPNKSSSSSDDEDGSCWANLEKKKWKKHVKNFSAVAKAKFAPIQAVYGALGAQEALKAATGLYNPIRQFLLYDCDEILLSKPSKDENNDASGISYIMGSAFAKRFSSKRIFVVGSGAIGCELLKNLAAMGAGTMPSSSKNKSDGGRIILTDMDTIEKSNLSRQLLFRDSDVGKFKSVAAKDAVHRFNPKVQMDVHTSRVGDTRDGDEGDGGPFNDQFWSDDVQVVMNALDNVEARLFMDSQCVSHHKGLIDAGTLGAKGNVQVVVPNESESYGSSVDPPEPAIPVCTLKNFPYEISHTIQWGRDIFDGLFSRRPSQVNDYSDLLSTMNLSDFAKMLLRKLGEDGAIDAAKEMSEDFLQLTIDDGEQRSTNVVDQLRSESLLWAVELFKKLFSDSMEALLRQHPLDSIDDDGEPFWSGTRRAPKVLSYSLQPDISEEDELVNSSIIDFVRFAARLRVETFLPESYDTGKSESNFLREDVVAALHSSQKTALTSDTSENDEKNVSNVLSEIIEILRKSKDNLKGEKKETRLNVADFEKDDESNGHIAFIMAASNLRALCYGIVPVDAMETRRIAGRIVPAMITTTGFVSALSCIELVKLLQECPLNCFHNSFVNLALPFFASTSPLPAEETSSFRGQGCTIWDRITIKEGEKAASKGGMSLRKFIHRIEKEINEGGEFNSEITNISYGPYLLYANFLHEDDKSILKTPLIDLIKEAVISGDDIDMDDIEDEDENVRPNGNLSPEQEGEIQELNRKTFIDLSVLTENTETGEEEELPVVRFIKWK